MHLVGFIKTIVDFMLIYVTIDGYICCLISIQHFLLPTVRIVNKKLYLTKPGPFIANGLITPPSKLEGC